MSTDSISTHMYYVHRPGYPQEDGGSNFFQGLEERALEGIWLSEPAGAGTGEDGEDVHQLGCYVTEREVGDDVFQTHLKCALFHYTTTHPGQLRGEEGGGGRVNS